MAQPSVDPRWDDVDTYSRRTEPTSGKKDVGWAEEERPAAEHLNWLFYAIWLWVSYLKNLAGEALTWTAQQTFNLAPQAPDYKFSTSRTTVYPAAAGNEIVTAGSAWARNLSPGGDVTTTSAGGTGFNAWQMELPVEQGDTVSEVKVRCKHGGTQAGTLRATLIRVDNAGTPTQVDQQSSLGQTTDQDITLNATLNGGVIADGAHTLVVQIDATGAGSSANVLRTLRYFAVKRTR